MATSDLHRPQLLLKAELLSEEFVVRKLSHLLTLLLLCFESHLSTMIVALSELGKLSKLLSRQLPEMHLLYLLLLARRLLGLAEDFFLLFNDQEAHNAHNYLRDILLHVALFVSLIRLRQR